MRAHVRCPWWHAALLQDQLVEKKKAMEQELQELQEKLEAAQYVGRLQ